MILISLLLISKQVLHCPPNQIEEMPMSHVTLNNMSNITDSIPAPPAISRTPDMMFTKTVPFNTTNCTLYI